jgi:xanthine dehydrogenase accessory factor
MTAAETDVLGTAVCWIGEGREIALGTVVKTWGSAPCRAGSQIAVRDDGAFAGSVSGGCVEGAVIEQALAAMKDGKVRRLAFGVTDEEAWSFGLACGGQIEVFVEPLTSAKAHEALLMQNCARLEFRSIVRAIDLATGEDRLIEPGSDSSPLASAADKAIASDQSGLAEIGGRQWFLRVLNPPVDLAIVGAVHIAQILAKLASLIGYRVRVIDPRQSYATELRFPGVALCHEWPDEALVRVPLGPRSALVTLTHDPKLDDPALVAALDSQAFYIGSLGSRRTHAARLARLKQLGHTDAALARIHGPVGLAIGATTPEEIALSIVAQITQCLRAAPSESAAR